MPGNSDTVRKPLRLFLLIYFWLGNALLLFAGDFADIGMTDTELTWLDNHPRIRVGIMNAWPPMDYVDEEGQPRGIGVRYIDALNKRLGNRLAIVPDTWQEIYAAVKEKRLDALMDITPNPERKKHFHFTRPYINIPHLIFIRKGEPYKHSLVDLAGNKVAVEHEFFLAHVLRNRYPQILISEFDNTSDALDALAKREVDAYVGNRAVAMHIIENELFGNIIAAGKITETSSENAIGVRADWQILRDILQKALDDIRPEERSEILQQTLGIGEAEKSTVRQTHQLSAEDRVWLDAHKPIQVAVMDGWPPFNFIDEDGNPSGIGIDYLNALNDRLEHTLKPVPGEWKRIFKDVEEKNLDVIMDITPKPEREASFNFTTPYLEVPHVIVAHKDTPFLTSEKSLEGRTLALEQGFGNVKYFQNNYPEVNLKLFTNTVMALEAVSRGDADAYAGNRVVALYLIDKHFLSNLRVHGRLSKPASELTLGVRKDWPRLRDILQRALDDVDEEERRDIIDRWIHPESAKGAQPTGVRLTDEELNWLSKHREIPIGIDGNWPPIDFIDQNGEHAGITADYINLLGERLGVRFIPEKSRKFKDMLHKVMQGDLNVGASISYKEERAEKLYFSKPFYQVHKVILARKDAEGLNRIEDLYGKRIAIEDGFLTMRELQEKHPQIALLPVASTLEALRLVSSGIADAYVGDQIVAGWLQKREHLDNLQVVGNPGLGSSPLNLAVSKKNPDWQILTGIIDKALADITKDERQRIEQRWLGKRESIEKLPLVNLTDREQRWLQEHKSIRLGVDADWVPVEFIDANGEYKGLSSEYMGLFSKQLGINWVKPDRLAWSEVLARLENRSIDVAPLISRTPEREQFLNYTKPYLDFPYVIFNRRGSKLLTGLDDLHGKKVAAVEGYSINEILLQEHPQLDYILYPNVNEALRSVSVGETDAYIGSLTVGGYLIGQHGLTNLQVAAPTAYSRKYSIGIRKDWPELVTILNKAIDTLNDEMKNDILRRWSTVKYEQQVDYTLVWRILGIALLILLIGSVWTIQIRRNKQIAQHARDRLELTLRSAQLGAWEAKVNATGTLVLSLDEIFHLHHGIPDTVQNISLEEFYDYVHEDSLPILRMEIERYLKSSVDDFIFEYRVRGQERWLYSKGHTLEWGDMGRPRYIVGITQDITERHRAHEALEKANRFKGEFLANMSHEIRTPMNAIIGLGHLLTKTSMSAKQRDYVHKMQVSAKSLLGIIDDILDFSKIEAGRLSIESIPFNFDDIFENLSIMATTRIGDSPIEFLYDFAPEIPHKLEGDPYRIGQILTNLVSNAVKFTERGSIVVRVSVKEISEEAIRLRFEVADTGIGISQDKLDSLFEPFTQADGSTTRKYGGTGLGLSICQQLCTLMGGSIGVESELDKGSTFHFELPLKIIASHRLPKPHPELRNLKVLLVDDNPMAQAVLCDMLESMTFKVTVTGSGTEALLWMNEPDTKFDLVLLDWRMPRIDGCETAKRIHENLGDKRPIIILMTAYGREVMEQDFSNAHLDGLLVKPLTPSLLFDAIISAYTSRYTDEPALIRHKESRDIVSLQGRILLVEDNEINQQVAKELLEQMGLSVDTAADGEKALQYLQSQRPNLVLMDIQMPQMDGFEATKRIRKMPGMADLPIFAMTAHALIGDADRSIKAGMNGHISKPVNPEELFRILSEHLPKTPSKRETPVDAKTATHWLKRMNNLPGLNIDDGVKQVGGKPEFYLKLLRDFVSDHRNCADEFAKQIEDARLDDAKRTVHTLRGVGGNIGAYDLQKVATELEMSLTNGGVPSAAMIKRLAEVCDSLFASINGILPDMEQDATAVTYAKPITEETEKELQALMSALPSGSAQSINLYEKLKPALVEKLESGQLDKLDELIANYDFEEADELLRDALGWDD